VAIKKLKPVIDTLSIPEGFAILPTPIVLFQKSTGELWANPAFENEFGKDTLHTFKFKKPMGLIQDRPVHLSALSVIGRQEGFVIETAPGTKIPVELKVSRGVDENPDTYLILFEAVTDKIELQKQLIQNHIELQGAYQKLNQTQAALIQSAKLASLGELSSGIAHELNQPLQAIMGFSQELKYMEKLSPTGNEFLDDVIHASQKMAEIIKSLRSFAREAGDQVTDTSVQNAISEAGRIMRHTLLQSGVDLEINCPQDLPLIQANPIQLEQVFVNLISNAKDATAGKPSGEARIVISATHTDENITIKVKDTGCGMSQEVQDKIFDPFFTTKSVGQGTGLGLSITYGILKKLGVQISVKSEVNVGTEFTLIFNTNETNHKGEIA
jgi:hypothetical protein